MQTDHNGQGNHIQVESVTQALHATLDPHISNDVRREALQFLESIKSQSDAPAYGNALAQDAQQSQVVRYYGLQLLEYAVKYRWFQYDSAQAEQLCQWIVGLARNLDLNVAGFHRNKIGQLWIECAKRYWGGEWLDMDEQLLELWIDTDSGKQPANKILVLYIIEMLAEDICNRDDVAAGLRLEILGSSLNEIVITQQLYQAHIQAQKGRTTELRHGQEGWLARICGSVAECIKHIRLGGSDDAMRSYRTCAAKGMNTLRALVVWLSLKAVVEVNCIDCLFLALHTEDTSVRTAAIETMYAILSRPSNAHFLEWELAILQQFLDVDRIALLGSVFEGAQFMPSTDDDVYTLQKKTSEVLSAVADTLLQHSSASIADHAIEAMLHLMVEVFQSQSLVISIPILHSWTKLLASQDKRFVQYVMQVLGTLVGICSQRLINYELLPEDSDVPVLQFLHQDFEIMPERHAFVGNYRRYCVTVIETIARQRPMDAITHVFDQMKAMLESGPYTRERCLDIETYSKAALPVLQFDAQFSVVLSVIKGYSAWEADVATVSQDDPTRPSIDSTQQAASNSLQQWCEDVVKLPIEDPEVAAHLLTILSSISRGTRAGPTVVMAVTHHLLSLRFQNYTSAPSYSESVRGFGALRVLEAQKIALVYADRLFEFYSELEQMVNQLIQTELDDERVVWGLKAFLFVVMQRTSRLDDQKKQGLLRDMIKPVLHAWQDPALQQAVSSVDSFCQALGLGNLPHFYQQHRFTDIEDWATQLLDTEGQARQADIRTRFERLPLRMTKSMLAATTEKLKDDSHEHEIASGLWESSIGIILPELLQMIRHAQAFINPATWSHLPPELQAVFQRTLQDRFWQSGISNESRDEFYARVNGSKSSYEGFASTVRGTMRNIREQGYHIIFLFTKFEEQFYGLSELPEPLAGALFDDADVLSTHHLQPIINLATGLIQRCPPQYRRRFLPPLLSRMFLKLDAKISGEWESLARATEQSADDNDLSEEMRIESVLRQLTFSMVSFVAFMLDYDKQVGRADSHGQRQRPGLAEVVLSDISILEPLIMFCTHALRMRDTRCCTWICKLLIGILPFFASDGELAPQVREFISTEVLKAGITSINEPYFADMQKDLAALIAQILLLYSARTQTPREVLLSIPSMRASTVDRTMDKLSKAKSARQQRAYVLDLLGEVRGVSIYESGKISRQDTSSKSKVQAQYMEVERQPTIVAGDDAGLDGLDNLFGGA